MKQRLLDLAQDHPELNLKTEVPLSQYTTFRIGGNADLLAEPTSIDQLRQLLSLCHQQKIPFFLMGNGSNLVIRDGGIRGMVIVLAEQFSDVSQVSAHQIRAQAGIRLGALARFAWQKSLSGLEFASGIPGTLGGAVTMNAGAYGGEMQHVVDRVWLLSLQGELHSYSGAEMEFGYRHSRVMREKGIVVEACFNLEAKDPQLIKDYLDDLAERRRSKQPIQYPSAGSFFKRPPGNYAGALIEQAGFKGYRVGDAQVSELHAGFIINLGNATARDVLQLKNEIQAGVFVKFGIQLEPEVRIIGEELHE